MLFSIQAGIAVKIGKSSVTSEVIMSDSKQQNVVMLTSNFLMNHNFCGKCK